jgi:hypothetical protein
VTGVRIRPAEPADAHQIAEVHVRGWQWGCRDLLPADVLDSLSVERREQGWVEILSSLPSGATVFVALEADRIVGFAGVGPAGTTMLQRRPASCPRSTSRRRSPVPGRAAP